MVDLFAAGSYSFGVIQVAVVCSSQLVLIYICVSVLIYICVSVLVPVCCVCVFVCVCDIKSQY